MTPLAWALIGWGVMTVIMGLFVLALCRAAAGSDDIRPRPDDRQDDDGFDFDFRQLRDRDRRP